MSRHKGARKRPIWKLFSWMGAFALTLTVLSLVPFASAEGNNGTLKIHEEGTPSGSESNGPKVCSFNVEGFGFDVGQTGYIMFEVQGGDEPTGTPAGPFSFGPANVDGFYATQYFDLDDGHYKATLYDDADNEKAKSKVFKVMCDEEQPHDECPNIPDNQPPGTDCNSPTPVINPGGNIGADCTGSGVAHADNSASTTSVGFEVVVNGQATLYSLAAGEVRDIAFSGAQPGSTVVLQDGEANELGSAVVPLRCEESPLECPAGTEWSDDNGNGVVDQGECIVIPVHPIADVTVAARCGMVVVTNNENHAMLFSFGSFGSLDGPDVIDDEVTVQPGVTMKIETTRRSIDWHAEGGGLVARGTDLAVPQDCDKEPPPDEPDALTNPMGLTGAPDTGLGRSDDPSSNGWLLLALAGLFGLGGLLLSNRRVGARR